MKYNFDQPVNRKNTNSFKWDKYGEKDVIPLWVADMDFEVAKPIQEALNAVTNHNVFGYAHVPDELNNLIINRLKKNHNWEVKTEWLVWLPGLVPGIYTSCKAVGKDGDAVMTATPVYRPFVEAPINNHRKLQTVPMLVDENGYHTFDFDGIKNSITDETKLFLLCNPHNPNGRVFSRKELQTLADICLEKNIVICSDEIHCDLILDETKKHISIATLSKDIENQSITLLAPSKTFNIAGLGCSLAVIPNDEIRANFMKAKYGILPMISSYSYESALAAYKYGKEWHEQLLTYLRGNQEYLVNEINQISGMKMNPLEATYLAWIDTKNVKKSSTKTVVELLEENGVGVMDASIFSGNDYFRLNFATQRSNLEEAVSRIKKVF